MSTLNDYKTLLASQDAGTRLWNLTPTPTPDVLNNATDFQIPGDASATPPPVTSASVITQRYDYFQGNVYIPGGTGIFTFDTWVYSNNGGWALDVYDTDGGYWQAYMGLDFVSDTNNGVSFPLNIGAWNHIAVTCGNAGTRLLLNGAVVSVAYNITPGAIETLALTYSRNYTTLTRPVTALVSLAGSERSASEIAARYAMLTGSARKKSFLLGSRIY